MRFGGRISTKPKSDIHIEIPVYLDQNDLTKLSYILIKVKTLNKRKFLSDWKDINQFWFEPKIIDRKFRLEMPFFLSIWMELLGDECETNNKVKYLKS